MTDQAYEEEWILIKCPHCGREDEVKLLKGIDLKTAMMICPDRHCSRKHLVHTAMVQKLPNWFEIPKEPSGRK